MPEYRYRGEIESIDIGAINRDIEAFCYKRDIAKNKILAIQLVVEETLSNICKYGLGIKKSVTVNIRLSEKKGSLNIEISDNGKKFNPLAADEPDTWAPIEDRTPGGLGIFLIKKKVKSIEYNNKDGINVLIAKI